MNSWRDSILIDFVPNISKLTLVADPDCLLTEERLATELRERGFDIIEFNDAIEFRYAFESQYRSIWDRGERTDLVVVLRLQDTELDELPYDLLQAGRRLSFNLGELFPNLSYPVIENLDRSSLDALWDSQRKTHPARMGDNATKDFVLRYVFNIDYELITDDTTLLLTLLRIHYGRLNLPSILTERLIELLSRQQTLNNWPLALIIPDEEAFYAFLQERWPIFLGQYLGSNPVLGSPPSRTLSFHGPLLLPFEQESIKVFIDNLFLEGKLSPVEIQCVEFDRSLWISCGVKTDENANEARRISRLLTLIQAELPAKDALYSDWIAFALKWAELTSKVHSSKKTEDFHLFQSLGEALNTAFSTWLSHHYASLINLPPTQPIMVHQIPRHLARSIEESVHQKVALIVVDGLALDQWITVREIIQKQDPNLVVRESAAFAWIPTVTSVSRQSIFSGKPPRSFPSTINSTNSEEKLWKQFWEENGLARLDVAYQRGMGDGNPQFDVDAIIHPSKTKAVGLVVDKVDKIMHGMQLGSPGMHNQIRQWCEGCYLSSLIGHLLDCGFNVWLTADHGNIECVGQGRPSEGVIAETRGERVRVYPTHELRTRVTNAFDFAREWLPVGLPPGYYPLFAAGQFSFGIPGDLIVGHGGISLEEVIVPLVKFERNKNLLSNYEARYQTDHPERLDG